MLAAGASTGRSRPDLFTSVLREVRQPLAELLALYSFNEALPYISRCLRKEEQRVTTIVLDEVRRQHLPAHAPERQPNSGEGTLGTGPGRLGLQGPVDNLPGPLQRAEGPSPVPDPAGVANDDGNRRLEHGIELKLGLQRQSHAKAGRGPGAGQVA